MISSNTQSLPTSVTSKGQVTIPADIREHLGIKPKDKVRFEVAEDGTVRVIPAPSRLAALFGSVKPLKKPEDFKALRQKFEEGVAESAIKRST
jgi:AbrB family looped-hinge helix DNA binding protein